MINDVLKWNDALYLKIYQEMCLSCEFKGLEESVKRAKMTPFMIWMSVRREIFLIRLCPQKWVILNEIWLKWYQIKAGDLLFKLIVELSQKW